MLYRCENRAHNKATNQISNRSAVDAGKSDTEIYVGHTDGRKDGRLDELYITNLVCYTYFHWFFSPECQHIFGKQTGYIFQSPKTIKTWTTKH